MHTRACQQVCLCANACLSEELAICGNLLVFENDDTFEPTFFTSVRVAVGRAATDGRITIVEPYILVC